MIPLEMASKCARKLKEATASTTASGAQAAKKSSTRGNPLSRNSSDATAASTKAITWLRVSADMQLPMAR